MGPSLRWDDGSWARALLSNEPCNGLQQRYFPRESRVINMAARFA